MGVTGRSHALVETAPPVSVFQPKEPGDLQVLWVGRALKGLRASRAPRGLQERRGREETRG